MDLLALDSFRPQKPFSVRRSPLILWNHRWEHDKDPETFFECLFALHRQNIPFELAVMGQSYRRRPAIFAQARKVLVDRIVHWGYADHAEYARWLWQADFLPVTSRHDFFGRSVVEAIWCGCYPLLPRRLAYPAHIPADLHETILYRDPEELTHRLAAQLQQGIPDVPARLRDHVRAYDWRTLAPVYDVVLTT
jgi:glycosyltransferase involved in cell wall biosynthesis